MCSLLSNLAYLIKFYFQSGPAETTWQSANKLKLQLENRAQRMAHRSIEETVKKQPVCFVWITAVQKFILLINSL